MMKRKWRKGVNDESYNMRWDEHEVGDDKSMNMMGRIWMSKTVEQDEKNMKQQ